MQLHNAWHAFRRGKKPSRAIDTFAYNLEAELEVLERQITAGTYRHGPYQAVVVQEKKRRELAVATVRDRVVHRLVYDELMEAFDHTFDPDVWSCRRGKGLHGCLARAQQLMRKHPTAYMWRMDITKFFDTVHHAILYQCLQRRPLGDYTLPLGSQVIRSYCVVPGVGIPIGNLTSQIFANIYLNEFDRYVRHVLKPLAYVRYGDDMVLWCRTRGQAEQLRRQATDFLASQLYLAVNPKNDVIVPPGAGLHFLGHAVTSSYIVVDRHTTAAVLQKSHSRSVASYKALLLANTPKRQLDWLLIDEIEEILE